jgi:hypothetical protein
MTTITLGSGGIRIIQSGQQKKKCISSDNHTLYDDYLEIKGHGNTIFGAHCIVYGNHNTVFGAHCKVIGDHNKVTGAHCKANGNSNSVTGAHCKTRGEGNKVTGAHCKMYNAKGELQSLPKSSTGGSSTFSNISIGGRVGTYSSGNLHVGGNQTITFTNGGMIIENDGQSYSMNSPMITNNHNGRVGVSGCTFSGGNLVVTDQGAFLEEGGVRRPDSPNTSNQKKKNKKEKILPDPIENELSAASGETCCVVCEDRSVKTAIFPCGHNKLCVTCSIKLKKESSFTCPICRAPIEKIIRLY